MAILFFEPVFKRRIWGNKYFKETLKYNLDDEQYGELWSLSAHKEGKTVITNGIYKGKTLDELYLTNPELFNSDYKEFPLMVKLLSTSDNLSVQVHPDDEYAERVENQYGKTECWYFIDSKEDSSIVIGHSAKNKDEMSKAIKDGACESLLSYNKINNKDFVLIPSKTVHALGKNLLLLEIQQSSDITYRLYDYNRKDKDGKTRELHIDKALQVINFPDNNRPNITNHDNNLSKETLCDCKYFNVTKYNIKEKYTFKQELDRFHIFSVSNGEFVVNGHKLSIGESFLSTVDEKEIEILGSGELLISYAK